MKESDIQKQVIQYARSKGLLVQANPLAEVMGFVPEKSRHKMVAFAKSMGWLSGYPDVSIDKGSKCEVNYSGVKTHFNGLRIELKSKSPFKSDGQLVKNEHIHKQARMIARLYSLGYVACFVWSFDMAKEIIDSYSDGSMSIRIRNIFLTDPYTGDIDGINIPLPYLK